MITRISELESNNEPCCAILRWFVKAPIWKINIWRFKVWTLR